MTTNTEIKPWEQRVVGDLYIGIDRIPGVTVSEARDAYEADLRTALAAANARIDDLTTVANTCINEALRQRAATIYMSKFSDDRVVMYCALPPGTHDLYTAPPAAVQPTEEQLQTMQQSAFDAGKAYGELGRPDSGRDAALRGPLRAADRQHCMSFAASLGIDRGSADALISAVAPKAYVNGFKDAEPVPFEPTKEQLEEWLERHGIQPAYSDAFYDAASLYLMAAQQGEQASAAKEQ